MGEAIDMLKDLEEALYYATITEAMESKESSQPIQYNNGGRSSMHQSGDHSTSYNNGGYSRNSSSMSNYTDMKMRDPWEGRSPEKRRMYMESRSSHTDKNTQIKELETYLQDLSSDIVEMI
jgi:hypothetical protein